jgi:hypothetical protein
MRTIIKTNIKDNTNVEVKESVKDVFNELIKKGQFVMLTRLSIKKEESDVIISKSAIKMVKTQKL